MTMQFTSDQLVATTSRLVFQDCLRFVRVGQSFRKDWMKIEGVCDIPSGISSSRDEHNENGVDNGNIAELIEACQGMEQNLVNIAFCAGKGWRADIDSMHAELSVKGSQGFERINIEVGPTCHQHALLSVPNIACATKKLELIPALALRGGSCKRNTSKTDNRMRSHSSAT
jgi:hypothetical protein